jgi:hypothetical protein
VEEIETIPNGGFLMKPLRAQYQSFLLRIWSDPEEDDKLRASLEDTNSREVTGFSSLKALFDYLLKLNGLDEKERKK